MPHLTLSQKQERNMIFRIAITNSSLLYYFSIMMQQSRFMYLFIYSYFVGMMSM